MAFDTPTTAIAPARQHNHNTVLTYCAVVGLGAILFGIDQGETTGFLAMPRYVSIAKSTNQT
jgi:hypothetical protein